MENKIILKALTDALSCGKCKARKIAITESTTMGNAIGYMCPNCKVRPDAWVLQNSELKVSIGYAAAEPLKSWKEEKAPEGAKE